MAQVEISSEQAARLQRERQTDFINRLLYETPGGVRFTQDSPILTNVWQNYAMAPRGRQKLILTVKNNKGAGQAALELREMLGNFRRRVQAAISADADQSEGAYAPAIPIGDLPGEKKRGEARISYIEGQISAELYFDEMMRLVLPLTPWWSETYRKLNFLGKHHYMGNWVRFPMAEDRLAGYLRDGLLNMRVEIDAENGARVDNLRTALGLADDAYSRRIRRLPSDLMWLLRIGGVIGRAFSNGYDLLQENTGGQAVEEYDAPGLALEEEFNNRRSGLPDDEDLEAVQARATWITNTRTELVSGFTDLYEFWSREAEPQHPEPYVWRVTRNRPIHLAVNKSSLTVKADAARRLFDISCKKITWAVVDSGIDGGHPAFRDHSSPDPKATRVTRTLDFTRIREILDYDFISSEGRDGVGDQGDYQKLLEKVAANLSQRRTKDGETAESRAAEKIRRLSQRMKRGQNIDWEDIEPLVLNKDPDPPSNDHGTHVAGILGADWIDDDRLDAINKADDERDDGKLSDKSHLNRRMQGVCPDINLIDVRVFRSDGQTDEFELLAAIQFLRWMNARAGYMEVHGANLSLSLIHEVRRFACGRTPVCEECNENAALGMVMVAAAGNKGFEADNVDHIRGSDGYRDTNITDPGNAEGVITVGSTHRKRPHDYGVSYFSSRGPTGDGRIKPDLVAPGEKIKGPTPNEGAEFKDGTSMAAPHVSGAAAMMMARNAELVGKPQRIKQILCDSTTDLGREEYFQGRGLLDILRALQSV